MVSIASSFFFFHRLSNDFPPGRSHLLFRPDSSLFFTSVEDSGYPATRWVLSGDNEVTQEVNGNPSFYCSDFDAFNTAFEGIIR
jgi:hypothetical protein